MGIRNIIKIDEELCNGCGQCIPACEEGAIVLVDGKARLVADKYCDGLGNCLGECPTGAITIIEREAEEFDAAAAEAWVAKQNQDVGVKEGKTDNSSCGGKSCMQANIPRQLEKMEKEGLDTQRRLGTWPVQIHLMPPLAPFLHGSELLVTADCVPVAYGRYQQDFVPGRVVLLGCPKFDDREAYVEKFKEIFHQQQIKKVVALDMEVPCCSGLVGILTKARELAGVELPITRVTIGINGQILNKEEL